MKKDIFRVFSSNLIKMLVTVITVFVIPMVLTVDDYGYYKTFTFYASYVGVTHLGFCDGIYLKYGGKRLEEIDRSAVQGEWSSILIYELLISFATLFFGLIRQDLIITCLGLIVIPDVVFTFYTYIYQSTGEFVKYTRIMNISTLLNLILNVALILTKQTDYRLYVGAYVLMKICSFTVGSIFCGHDDLLHFSGVSGNTLIMYIKLGILLMVGNFAYTLFIGLDKWFIKFNMDISQFSMYSFASQMLTVVNMFVTPISMTLYSYISRRKDKNFETRIKKMLVCFLMIFPLAIYALSFIIKQFMKQYIPAIDVVSILLITQIFLSINMAVFVNLYKAYQKQNEYFIRLLAALAMAFVLDLLVTVIRPDIKYYAFATLVSCIVWMLLNMKYYNHLIPKLSELVYVVALLGIYLFSLLIDNIFIRSGIYVIALFTLTYLLMNDEWKYFIKQFIVIKNKLSRIR